MAIIVNAAKCIGCGSCVLLCPEEALDVSPSFVVEVDSENCTECLTCLDCCSNDALGEST
ncbi:MAG: 4Fe-4S binding protein [Chloroflexi bacterium]|nr:4Fe-4S binding protein [Chloroflexota bacterium]